MAGQFAELFDDQMEHDSVSIVPATVFSWKDLTLVLVSTLVVLAIVASCG